MFDLLREQLHKKQSHAFEIRGMKNIGGFFQPFPTFDNARKQLQAPILMPLIDLSYALSHAIFMLENVGEFAVRLVTFDSSAKNSAKGVLNELASTVYFTVSLLTDALISTIALATRTLATVASGLAKVTGVLLDCCSFEAAPSIL